MTNYTTRDWKSYDLPLGTFKGDRYPVAPSSLNRGGIMGTDSPMAARREESGRPVFYFDLEQLEAGMDATYGMGELLEAQEDFHLEEGILVLKGALIAPLTKVNIETGTGIYLIERSVRNAS